MKHTCIYCGYWSFNANHLRMRKCPRNPWWRIWSDTCTEGVL